MVSALFPGFFRGWGQFRFAGGGAAFGFGLFQAFGFGFGFLGAFAFGALKIVIGFEDHDRDLGAASSAALYDRVKPPGLLAACGHQARAWMSLEWVAWTIV